jgi:hypothetical protein
MDVDEFLAAVTPEQMDRIEAQAIVRWQRESLATKHLIAATLASQGAEIDWDAIESMCPDWFPKED